MNSERDLRCSEISRVWWRMRRLARSSDNCSISTIYIRIFQFVLAYRHNGLETKLLVSTEVFERLSMLSPLFSIYGLPMRIMCIFIMGSSSEICCPIHAIWRWLICMPFAYIMLYTYVYFLYDEFVVKFLYFFGQKSAANWAITLPRSSTFNAIKFRKEIETHNEIELNRKRFKAVKCLISYPWMCGCFGTLRENEEELRLRSGNYKEFFNKRMKSYISEISKGYTFMLRIIKLEFGREKII